MKFTQITQYALTDFYRSKNIILKDGFAEKLINKCFMKVTDNTKRDQQVVLKVDKNLLNLVLVISFHIRIKLWKSSNASSNEKYFDLKITFPTILLLVSFINFTVYSATGLIMVNVRDT